jgi:hypothetical protein
MMEVIKALWPLEWKDMVNQYPLMVKIYRMDKRTEEMWLYN